MGRREVAVTISFIDITENRGSSVGVQDGLYEYRGGGSGGGSLGVVVAVVVGGEGKEPRSPLEPFVNAAV